MLVIVDFQNDYCHPEGRFGQLGLIDRAALEDLADRLQILVERVRAAGQPVVFLRTVVDPQRIPETVRARREREGRTGAVAPGSWGAEFFRLQPLAGEAVLAKNSYDPFLSDEFPRHLERHGIAHLTVAGVFTDLCVDALARTAYQKGIAVTVLEDATMPLQRDQQESLQFMARFYGTRIASGF